MKIFISEYLCSGACIGADLPLSLLNEGIAMLAALIEDMLRIPEVSVYTSWDGRLPKELPFNVNVFPVSTADQEWSTFQQLVVECDATYIIAPEFKNILTSRCQYVCDNHKSLLNVMPDAVQTCADKFQLWQLLTSHNIPTVDTERVDDVASYSPQNYPFVVKPTDGAGALATYRVNSKADWPAVRDQLLASDDFATFIAQPYIAGQSCSTLVCVGETTEVFPIGHQHLGSKNAFTYNGGTIPRLHASCQATLVSSVESIVQALPNLVGLWGIDFISPDSNPTIPSVVEINPRLTTSYVGYRRLTGDNIAERLLFQDRVHSPIQWSDASIRFTTLGEVELTNE